MFAENGNSTLRIHEKVATPSDDPRINYVRYSPTRFGSSANGRNMSIAPDRTVDKNKEAGISPGLFVFVAD